jgi:peptidoglycan hydrolase-like protein with peptidoglycan-binding domain
MVRTTITGVLFTLVLFTSGLAHADTQTASIQSLSPGASVVAKNRLTFSVVTSGFVAQSYQLSDSFSGSTASMQNFDGGGNFSWVPLVSDVGTHTFTITSRNFDGSAATVTQTITVLPPPSISISAVSPSSVVMPGTTVNFTVVQQGFTNPTYIISDDFGGSTATNVKIGPSGNFSWTPDLSQNGKHRITIYANGTSGQSASVHVDVQVGAGPTLFIGPATPGTIINAGTTISFSVAATNFQPTNFTVSDSIPSTISNGNINTSGMFSWTPSGSDVGTHVLTFKGQVGVLGESGTSSRTIYVVGMGASTSSPPVAAAPIVPNVSAMTAGAGAVVGSLQAQLADLLSQIEAKKKTGTNVTVSPQFTAYLKPGVQNDQVTHLQQLLTRLGFYTGEITGYYGNMTVDAVAAFQKSKGLAQLGVVGPATRAALNALAGTTAEAAVVTTPSTLQKGSGYIFEHFMGYGDDTLPDVLELQKKLQLLGFLSVEPTGFYGNATVTAVKKFQMAKGLPAVGYCDKATRAALNQ